MTSSLLRLEFPFPHARERRPRRRGSGGRGGRRRRRRRRRRRSSPSVRRRAAREAVAARRADPGAARRPMVVVARSRALPRPGGERRSAEALTPRHDSLRSTPAGAPASSADRSSASRPRPECRAADERAFTAGERERRAQRRLEERPLARRLAPRMAIDERAHAPVVGRPQQITDEQPPSRREDAEQLADHGARIRDVVKDAVRHHATERPSRVRERLRVDALERLWRGTGLPRRRCAPPRGASRRRDRSRQRALRAPSCRARLGCAPCRCRRRASPRDRARSRANRRRSERSRPRGPSRRSRAPPCRNPSLRARGHGRATWARIPSDTARGVNPRDRLRTRSVRRPPLP